MAELSNTELIAESNSVKQTENTPSENVINVPSSIVVTNDKVMEQVKTNSIDNTDKSSTDNTSNTVKIKQEFDSTVKENSLSVQKGESSIMVKPESGPLAPKPVTPRTSVVKPRSKPLTGPRLTPSDLAKEVIERVEKRQKTYPDRVDILLAMKSAVSPNKPTRKVEPKLDTNELLSILQDGAEGHYSQPKPPKAPRTSKSAFKELNIDPELEKHLALQQLMHFSQGHRSRQRRVVEKDCSVRSDVENNNHSHNSSETNNVETKLPKPVMTPSANDSKITPNRELKKLLQDEGAINMLYAIEKGENDKEEREKLLPSKRRMKKALMKKAQEVTQALLGASSSSTGPSLRHRSGAGEKRKLSTESAESEHEPEKEEVTNQFPFTPPPSSRIIRRHSSSSSYSSRASSPRLSSPPPPNTEEEIRLSKRTEALIDVKCKELNLLPEHSKLIKKLIHDKKNGLKERLQSEFAQKLKMALHRGETQQTSPSEPTNEQKTAIWKMVEEDWGSGSDSEEPKTQPPAPVNKAAAITTVPLTNTTPTPSIFTTATATFNSNFAPPTSTLSTKTAAVVPSFKTNIAPIVPVASCERRIEEIRMPKEVSAYREIKLTMTDDLASLTLAATTTLLPNALSTKVLRELSLALEYVSQIPEIKCITLTSEGPDFCLGFDLPGLLSSDPSERRVLAAQAALAIKEFAVKMCMLGKPLVAGVKGRAVGLGVVLLAYCDVVVAEPCASFTTPYPKLGCFPEAAATFLLPQIIGLAPARKLMLGCAKVSCVEAESCGLVTRLVPEGALTEEVFLIGKDVLSYSHQILGSTKAVLMHGLRTKLPSVLETEVKLLQQHWTSEDCQQRIATLRDNPFF